MNTVIGVAILAVGAGIGMVMQFIVGVRSPSFYWGLGAFSGMLATAVIVNPFLR